MGLEGVWGGGGGRGGGGEKGLTHHGACVSPPHIHPSSYIFGLCLAFMSRRIGALVPFTPLVLALVCRASKGEGGRGEKPPF
jgi:hypothetical protein